jgi:hypothetical protein
LHDPAAEKVDTQNPIDRLVTALAERTEVDSQDRFWKSYTAAYRLQIVYAISKTLPVHALNYLSIAQIYSKAACCPEIDSANPST